MFLFNGVVKLPKIAKPNLLTPDKIKSIYLLENTVDKIFNQVALSIQYSNCLITASLNTEESKIQIELPEMVPRN